MGNLTGSTVASTYNQLLNLDTGAITSSLKEVQDGLGDPSALSLSSGAVKSSGTLEVTGLSTLTGAVTAPGGVTGDLTGTASLVAVTDSTAATAFPVVFNDESDALLDDTGTFTYQPSTGELVATTLTGDVTGDLTGNVTAASVLADGVTATTQAFGDSSTKVATTAFARLVLPSGCIMQYGGASAPDGWLFCDGSAKDSVSDTTLAALYTAIGNTYGGSDGSDFELPDLQGNVPVGKDSSTFSTLGATGGAEDVTLTSAQSGVPVHTHALTSVWSYTAGSQLGGAGGSGAISATGNNVAADAASSHTNLQPYIVVNYIIKT